MDEGHFLRPLTKGTARLAFQAQEKMNSDLMIVPVGINYFHHYRPRNRCIIKFGNALRVKDYQKRYHENKAKGLIALKDDLTIAMKEQLLIPDKGDYNDKKKALNRLNERKGFKELKTSISTNTFNTAKYYSWLGPVANSLPLFQASTNIGKAGSREGRRCMDNDVLKQCKELYYRVLNYNYKGLCTIHTVNIKRILMGF